MNVLDRIKCPQGLSVHKNLWGSYYLCLKAEKKRQRKNNFSQTYLIRVSGRYLWEQVVGESRKSNETYTINH